MKMKTMRILLRACVLSTLFLGQVYAQYPRIMDPSTVNQIPNDTVKKEIFDHTLWRIYYDYDLVINPRRPADTKVSTIGLMKVGRQANMFLDYYESRVDSMLDANAKAGVLPSEYINTILKEKHRAKFEHIVLYDRRAKSWVVQESVPFEMSSRYSEASLPMQWTIIEGDTVIAGYRCLGATTSYRGRDYVAWYTEEISIPYGPYKFFGLPGLVMKVADSMGHHVFTFRGMEQVKGYEPIYLPSSNLIARDRDTHRKILRNARENLGKAIAESGRVQVTKKDRADVVEQKRPYNPIELE